MYLGIEHEKTFIDQGSFNKSHRAWILSFIYDYSEQYYYRAEGRPHHISNLFLTIDVISLY
jgi:hypothetical protein